MKRKVAFLCIFILIIAVGVCGCMDHKDYENEILNELERRYNKTFEIQQLTAEFDGNSGKFYRAVCKPADGGNLFVARYSCEKKVLYDEYCDMLLKEDIAQYLVSGDLGISYAVVNVITVGRALKAEDVAKGVEYCLSNDEFDVKVAVYAFLDQSLAADGEAEKKILDKLLSLDIYRCNLDVAYMTSDGLVAAKEEYTDVYRLGDRLEEDGRVSGYKCYIMSRESGIQSTQIVKGE